MKHRRIALLFSVGITSILLVFAASQANAFPSYLDAWIARYPRSTIPTRMDTTLGTRCYTCHHLPAFGDPGSCYRLDLIRELNYGYSIEEAIERIDGRDSDGDGMPNGIEILTPRADDPTQVGYHPGYVGPMGTDPCLRPEEPVTGQLETPCQPCDTNCDGSVNGFDIQGFVDALNPSPPPGCSPCAADANHDGSINAFDIQPFVECLGG